jgi:hypothetical protein
MALATPFASGKDCVLRLFLNANEVILNAKSWNITADVTKVADGVNGEDRDRPYSFINMWNITAQCFVDKGAQLDAILSYFDNNDQQVAPFDTSAGVNFKLLDGSKKAYVFQEGVIDDPGLNNSDRKERIMFTLNMRARYLRGTPTF